MHGVNNALTGRAVDFIFQHHDNGAYQNSEEMASVFAAAS